MSLLIRLFIAGTLFLPISCVTTQKTDQTAGIGPYHHFSGRLLVIQPANRWQAELDWRGDANAGQARLTHAASSRIIEIQWLGETMQLRDNQQHPAWQLVDEQRLYQQGIIMLPQQLADILNGNMPASLHKRGSNHWEGMVRNSHLKLIWKPDQQRMEITDITHGNRLILIIEL